MFKKFLVILSSILIVAGLFACGNNAEVEELKRQVAELKQQNEYKRQNDDESRNTNNSSQTINDNIPYDRMKDISYQIKNAKVVKDHSVDTKLGQLDTVIFGHDENNNSLEWVVCEKDEDTHQAFLLSKYLVAIQPYDISDGSSWEKSYIRRWLNEEFYQKAFNDVEKESIIAWEVSDGYNSIHTYDKLFLLDRTMLDWFDDHYKCIALEDDDWLGATEWMINDIYKFHDDDPMQVQAVDKHGVGLRDDVSALRGVRPAMVVQYK